MSWWVPLVIIILNLGFGIAGYLLGRKTQGQADGKEFLRRAEEFKKAEKEIEVEVEEKLNILADEKQAFQNAAWNEKMKILGKKKQS